MDNTPIPIPVKHIGDVKTYSLVWFHISDDLACSDAYLVDKKSRRILMYRMNRPAKDVTAQAQRWYTANLKKSLLQRKIGGELFSLMENHDDSLRHIEVIAHSDSAREMEQQIYDLRILQAERYIRRCRHHGTWSTEEATVEYFADI